MDNKIFYCLLTWGLALLAIFTNFVLFMTMVLALLLLEVFIIPNMDFSKEFSMLMQNTQFEEETVWKIMLIIVMFFALTVALYSPMNLMFEYIIK